MGIFAGDSKYDLSTKKTTSRVKVFRLQYTKSYDSSHKKQYLNVISESNSQDDLSNALVFLLKYMTILNKDRSMYPSYLSKENIDYNMQVKVQDLPAGEDAVFPDDATLTTN